MADSNNMSDLWKRLRFVIIGIIVYRIGTHIPIPGIDPERLSSLFDQNQGTILELFNLFSGVESVHIDEAVGIRMQVSPQKDIK